jgi:shikimate dehydrogenase
MCSAGFAALGLPHLYTAIDVPTAAGLARLVDDLRTGSLAGCNVTIPYKQTVLDHADERAESAAEVGAANVLTVARGRVTAHNTDAEALARDIDAVEAGRPRLRAAIIGAGGAGLAALVACRRLGFNLVCVTSRSWTNTEIMFESPAAQKARALGALPAPWPQPDDASAGGKASQALRLQWRELVSQADCVIQATSAGMLGADPGEDVAAMVAWDQLPPHALAYDVVYNPRVTPFLRAARARKLVAMDGLGMLVRQAALAISLWTGREPPLDRMRKAAEEALEGGPPHR